MTNEIKEILDAAIYNDSNVIVNNLQLLESKDAVELRESKKAESAK